MKKSELRNIIKEELKKMISEKFKPTKETAMIYIGGYPWYVKKIDSTHLNLVNNEKYVNSLGLGAAHIGQYRRETYYNDLRKWLNGELSSKELNGRKYEGIG